MQQVNEFNPLKLERPLTANDSETLWEVRWRPGRGDCAILMAAQAALVRRQRNMDSISCCSHHARGNFKSWTPDRLRRLGRRSEIIEEDAI